MTRPLCESMQLATAFSLCTSLNVLYSTISNQLLLWCFYFPTVYIVEWWGCWRVAVLSHGLERGSISATLEGKRNLHGPWPSAYEANMWPTAPYVPVTLRTSLEVQSGIPARHPHGFPLGAPSGIPPAALPGIGLRVTEEIFVWVSPGIPPGEPHLIYPKILVGIPPCVSPRISSVVLPVNSLGVH